MTTFQHNNNRYQLNNFALSFCHNEIYFGLNFYNKCDRMSVFGIHFDGLMDLVARQQVM